MVIIEQPVLEAMIADGKRSFPDECCGFLFGREEGNNRILTSVLVVNNSKQGDKRRKFEIAARDYLLAERYAEEQQLALLGVYHSHPDAPPVPSEHDRLAAQPYFSYVILSIVKGQYAGLRSWQLNDQFVFEEEKTEHAIIIQ